jgi:hypothetical protein
VHLCAHVDARLVSALIVALRECNAFRVGGANGVIVFAKTTSARAAGDAIGAVVLSVASGRTTKSHLIDAAARGAFLAEEAIDHVDVVIVAIEVHVCACVLAHGVVGGAGVVAIEEIDAVAIERT